MIVHGAHICLVKLSMAVIQLITFWARSLTLSCFRLLFLCLSRCILPTRSWQGLSFSRCITARSSLWNCEAPVLTPRTNGGVHFWCLLTNFSEWTRPELCLPVEPSFGSTEGQRGLRTSPAPSTMLSARFYAPNYSVWLSCCLTRYRKPRKLSFSSCHLRAGRSPGFPGTTL
mgnify:CR=1 FL=1